MLLKNAVSSAFSPIIPEILASHIHFCTTCPLTESESSMFTSALDALAQTLSEECVSLPDCTGTCVITNSDEFGFQLISKQTLGGYVPIIIYPIHRWRSLHLNKVQMLACILEELCHFIYNSFDEELTKDRVVEVARHISPDYGFHVLYPGMCAG